MADNELKLKISAEVSKMGISDLRKDLKETQKTLDDLRTSGQQNSKEWENSKTRAGVLSQEIRKLGREYKGLDGQVKASKFQMLEFGENLTVVTAGLFMVGKALAEMVKAMKEMTMEGAEFSVWKDSFTEMQGGVENATKSLDLMRKASSGNLDEKEIILYTNKMKMLGFALDDSAKLLKLVDIQGDKMGVTFRQGQDVLQGFIMTGRKMALKEMGINAGEVTKKIDELTIATGKSKDALTDEEIQAIRLNAILQVTGVTMKEVTDSELDAADKLLMFESATRNAKLEIGQLISKGLIELIDSLGATSQSATSTAGYITAIGGEVAKLLPALAALKIALGTAFASIFTVGIPAIAGLTLEIGFLYIAIDGLLKGWGRFVDFISGDISIGKFLWHPEDAVVLKWLGIIGDEEPFEQAKSRGFTQAKKTFEVVDYGVDYIVEKSKDKTKTGGKTAPKQIKEDSDEAKKSLDEMMWAIKGLAVEMQRVDELARGWLKRIFGYEEKNKISDEIKIINTGLNEMAEPVERIQTLSEAFGNLNDEVSLFFEALTSGEVDGFKQMLKNVAQSMLDFVQLELIGATASSILKAVLTGGLSVIRDLPQLALATLLVQSLKGMISGLATGGTATAGTPYIVGERGRELFIPNQTGYVMNNRQLEMALSGGGAVNNVYISADIDGVKFLKRSFPQYMNATKFKLVR